MNLLMKCATSYQKLMDYEYQFTLGRKGKMTKITLQFPSTNFHHLAGLHKLKDISIARANRSTVFYQILDGRITYDTIKKSRFLPEIQSRLDSLPYLESFLDENPIIFRFNKTIYPRSAIESEFLLKMGNGTILGITFLFLDKSKQSIYFCRSFFPMEKYGHTQKNFENCLFFRI